MMLGNACLDKFGACTISGSFLCGHERERSAGDVYGLCAAVTSPQEKVITAQLRRSALSISANLAEGCSKRSRAEGIRYLEISAGSAAETVHHLSMAADLKILPLRGCTRLSDESEQIGRMIRALINRFPAADDRVREQEVLRL